jgi:hypothetical protein
MPRKKQRQHSPPSATPLRRSRPSRARRRRLSRRSRPSRPRSRSSRRRAPQPTAHLRLEGKGFLCQMGRDNAADETKKCLLYDL